MYALPELRQGLQNCVAYVYLDELTDVCVMQASQEERLLEMFGCGTACIVQPVNELIRKNGDKYAVPFDLTRTDTLTQRLTRALTDIHYANVPHKWSVAID